MAVIQTLATGEDAKVVARSLYWQGFRITAIAEMLSVARTTIHSWKEVEKWDESKPIDRVECALEAKMIQLIYKAEKDGKDFKEIDLLGRQMVNLARVREYEITGKEGSLNPKINNRGKGERKKTVHNEIGDEQQTLIYEAYMDDLFDYQKKWHEAGKHFRIRNILKSRQIGATWYFAREAFIDALETGRNQIFLSASKNQALLFRQYIVQFAKDIADVELTGDPIILENGATLYFLGTNSRTAQSYHGNVYMDEYFWIHRFTEFRKVASGMAMHKKWRQTYFSTPSSKQHQAYKFWDGNHFNRGRHKDEKISLDISHRALANGHLCADGQWRQIVTVEDALKGGCDLFDLDQLRIEYSADEYENLLMCQFIDDTLSAFSVTQLQACMIDADEEWNDIKLYADRPFGNRPVWLGYDPSMTGDSAGLVVLAAPTCDGGLIRGIERIQFRDPDFESQAERIREMTLRYNVVYMGIDVTGLGAGVFQIVKTFFPGVVPLQYNPELKGQFVLKALDVIRKGRFQFDHSWTDLVASFCSIHKTLTNSERAVTYKSGRSEETGHADLAWACMHALHHEPLAVGHEQQNNVMEISE